MNRWDEIQGLARDVASNVHADPAARDAMADGLIKLVAAMLNGLGKVVSTEGESAMNEVVDWGELDKDDRAALAVARATYTTGERIITASNTVRDSSVNAGCDLDRWEPPVWHHVDRRPYASADYGCDVQVTGREAGRFLFVYEADDLSVMTTLPRKDSGPTLLMGEGDCQGECCGGTGPMNYSH